MSVQEFKLPAPAQSPLFPPKFPPEVKRQSSGGKCMIRFDNVASSTSPHKEVPDAIRQVFNPSTSMEDDVTTQPVTPFRQLATFKSPDWKDQRPAPDNEHVDSCSPQRQLHESLAAAAGEPLEIQKALQLVITDKLPGPADPFRDGKNDVQQDALNKRDAVLRRINDEDGQGCLDMEPIFSYRVDMKQDPIIGMPLTCTSPSKKLLDAFTEVGADGDGSVAWDKIYKVFQSVWNGLDGRWQIQEAAQWKLSVVEVHSLFAGFISKFAQEETQIDNPDKNLFPVYPEEPRLLIRDAMYYLLKIVLEAKRYHRGIYADGNLFQMVLMALNDELGYTLAKGTKSAVIELLWCLDLQDQAELIGNSPKNLLALKKALQKIVNGLHLENNAGVYLDLPFPEVSVTTAPGEDPIFNGLTLIRQESQMKLTPITPGKKLDKVLETRKTQVQESGMYKALKSKVFFEDLDFPSVAMLKNPEAKASNKIKVPQGLSPRLYLLGAPWPEGKDPVCDYLKELNKHVLYSTEWMLSLHYRNHPSEMKHVPFSVCKEDSRSLALVMDALFEQAGLVTLTPGMCKALMSQEQALMEQTSALKSQLEAEIKKQQVDLVNVMNEEQQKSAYRVGMLESKHAAEVAELQAQVAQLKEQLHLQTKGVSSRTRGKGKKNKPTGDPSADDGDNSPPHQPKKQKTAGPASQEPMSDEPMSDEQEATQLQA